MCGCLHIVCNLMLVFLLGNDFCACVNLLLKTQENREREEQTSEDKCEGRKMDTKERKQEERKQEETTEHTQAEPEEQNKTSSQHMHARTVTKK